MIEVRAKKYAKELGSEEYLAERTDESAWILSEIALEIIIKSNLLATKHTCLEELTRDYCQKNIRNKIYRDIKEHLWENDSINFDGYIDFRTRAYADMRDEFLSCVMKKIAVKVKRDGLIEELRRYVAQKEPGKSVIYLKDAKGHYELFDEAHNLLMREAICEYAAEYGLEGELISADIVMNYLLIKLPKKIFLQMKNETPSAFIKTLTLVFGDRVSEFNGH